MAVDEQALEFLGRLERAESATLAWGLVDGFFSDIELEERAEAFLADQRQRGVEVSFASGWEVVEALLDSRLLWRVPDSSRYRTRMAEAVRLFARLRQMFPTQQANAWRDAPTLVSDYRLLLGPRAYPRRDTSPDEALDEINRDSPLSTLSRSVLRALMRTDTPQPRSLARFQARATASILRRLKSERTTATIVCAGTGSGKTLAFYLPALAKIAERINDQYWTKCIALYPRNELLKDQLREAITNARRITPSLAAVRKRRLLLGALYMEVPWRPEDLLRSNGFGNWRAVTVQGAPAFECPFVRCPTCSEPMAWLRDDVVQHRERLVCMEPACRDSIEKDELCLTRERMVVHPPDILFSSTEMLSQRLSSSQYNRLLGIGLQPERRPDFVLLDEVHTYEGTHGAHVALLLRRWRRVSEARPHFVGLSATLADAPRFFSDLIGVGLGDVTEVSPDGTEMHFHGMEYMLALRGDPSTGTSLLSTTIQALMLLRRILSPSSGNDVYGSKVFAFTDNLDVINRLYFSLLDAEGWDAFRRPNAARAGGALANLRASTAPSSRERLDAGQNWVLVEDIGHPLAPNVRVAVSRTSSQDLGVDFEAGVVVATSSLEVGFDDPEVGAVLQHKSPQSAAAFLQRKGRGGRRQNMRPWTVVVLSDFGRDRIAYQAYEQLFSPQLPPRHLPLENRAILRMQATFALFDWLAYRIPISDSPEPWTDFARPSTEVNSPQYRSRLRHRQGQYSALLRSLLEQDRERREFAQYLARSLSLEDDAVSALLWEPPRGILTEAVPTLLRRLERDWRLADGSAFEYYERHSPLPEFVPKTLFSDLQLPELEIRIPALGRIEARTELMPLAQGLREFAPGRVSRRFGVNHGGDRHWIDPASATQVLIDTFCAASDRQEVGRFRYRTLDGHREVTVFRPYALTVSVAPLNIQQSSNSFLDWRTEIVPTGEGHEVDSPSGTRWAGIVQSLRFHTHHFGIPVEVRRYAIGAHATIGQGQGRPQDSNLSFVCSGIAPDSNPVPAALGFVADVDALRVQFIFPGQLHSELTSDQRLLRGLRPARFKELLRSDASLDGVANQFERDWCSQVYLSAVSAEALRSGLNLETAESRIHNGSAVISLFQVLETLLRREYDEGNPQGQGGMPVRLQEISDLLRSAVVVDSLHRAAPALWVRPDETWEPWLRDVYRSTLGSAIVDAALKLCPRVDPSDLNLDLRSEGRPQSDEGELWLTESTIGGGGFIEELLTRYVEDPRRFFRLMDSSLGPSDLELVDQYLTRTLDLITIHADHNQSLISAIAQFRNADSHSASLAGLHAVRDALALSGVLPTPTLMIAANARILRPGTSPETDRYVGELVRDLSEAEGRLGIEIDNRIFALVRSDDSDLEAALGVIPQGDSDQARSSWRYSVLTGMLWPRGSIVRSTSLEAYNPFSALPTPDRLLILSNVVQNTPRIAVATSDWFSMLSAALVQHGSAEIFAPIEDPRALSRALIHLGCNPVDAEALLVHARLAGIRIDDGQIFAEVELPEAYQ